MLFLKYFILVLKKIIELYNKSIKKLVLEKFVFYYLECLLYLC